MSDPNAPHRSDANVEPEREHATHEPEDTTHSVVVSTSNAEGQHARRSTLRVCLHPPQDIVGEDTIRDDIMRAATERANALLVSYLRNGRLPWS